MQQSRRIGRDEIGQGFAPWSRPNNNSQEIADFRSDDGPLHRRFPRRRACFGTIFECQKTVNHIVWPIFGRNQLPGLRRRSPPGVSDVFTVFESANHYLAQVIRFQHASENLHGRRRGVTDSTSQNRIDPTPCRSLSQAGAITCHLEGKRFFESAPLAVKKWRFYRAKSDSCNRRRKVGRFCR